MRGFRHHLVCVGLVMAVISGAVSADMLVSPTRAVLDRDNATATFTLRNTGDGPRTYRIGWAERQMNEQGRYSAVDDEQAWPSAARMLRHSPRQITVEGGENQRVRLRYRPPGDVSPGEYRSHLQLQVLPDVSEPDAVLDGGDLSGEQGIGLRLEMAMSFSIPVIIREGIDQPEVALTDVVVEQDRGDGVPRLSMTLERMGQASSFGDVVVEMQRDRNTPVKRIARNRDIAVFHEIDRRKVSVPLRDVEIPSGAWIRVAYEGRQEYRGITWDEQVFQAE